MDRQLEQNFQKLAKNIIIRLQNNIIEGTDFIKFEAFFKISAKTNLLKNDLLILFAESLINAQIENKSTEALNPLKDEVCNIYTNLLTSKVR